MSIFRISETSRGAAEATVEKARQAEEFGYTDVETHYHPGENGQPGTHSVTGTPPAVPEAPRRGISGR
ncbi:hypothetical protein [Kitasatospora sp. NPDC001175]|uniref:hypothetical protein n=1 Tax=Kitasatospora sp. NPDC001175 TaxID=3157103 RepID=UPI003CFD22FD